MISEYVKNSVNKILVVIDQEADELEKVLNESIDSLKQNDIKFQRFWTGCTGLTVSMGQINLKWLSTVWMKSKRKGTP